MRLITAHKLLMSFAVGGGAAFTAYSAVRVASEANTPNVLVLVASAIVTGAVALYLRHFTQRMRALQNAATPSEEPQAP